MHTHAMISKDYQLIHLGIVSSASQVSGSPYTMEPIRARELDKLPIPQRGFVRRYDFNGIGHSIFFCDHLLSVANP